MANPDSFIGTKFNSLTVKEYRGKNKDNRMVFLCKCDCGNEKEISIRSLKSGNTKSCGCLLKAAAAKMGKQNKTHGLKHHRLYRIFQTMKSRCYNPKAENYAHYGEKGIGICEEWLNDFVSFYDWAITNGYSDDLTIDRVDNNKGYSPSNCRWATTAEQNVNKTSNHFVTIQGETKTVSQWLADDRVNIGETTFYSRIKNGMTEEEALLS